MRPLWLAWLLIVAVVLPVGQATHASRETVTSSEGVVGRFEMDATAVRPPAVVAGEFVLESRSQPAVVNGTIVVRDRSTTQELSGASLAKQELKRVDAALEPYTQIRIPISVDVNGIGPMSLSFEADRPDGPAGEERVENGFVLPNVRVDAHELVGLAAVEVSVDVGPLAQLVSTPGRPAQVKVTLTAMPGSDLTDLHLTGYQSSTFPPVHIGELAPGQSRTVTIAKDADGEGSLRFRNVLPSSIVPELQGLANGKSFSHVLHRTDLEEIQAIHPVVYVAPESTAFLIPPTQPRLGAPATLDVVLLNAGESATRIEVTVQLSMAGLPHLDRDFRVVRRVAAGSVETVILEWTPPAAGPWQASTHHNLGRREPPVDSIHVGGPIASVDFQKPTLMLDRGRPAIVNVVIASAQDVSVSDLRITTAEAPLEGAIAIDDLFDVRSGAGAALAAGTPSSLALHLKPKATGSYETYLVIATTEGPSVHNVGAITVAGAVGDWPLTWGPTFLVAALLAMHFAWRRWWAR